MAIAAIPLAPGQWQFCDADGVPYAAGTLNHYYPGGLSPKDTYQDPQATTLNDNPLTLDSAGRATIFGIGEYRQILRDVNGNTIWDKATVGLIGFGADIVLTFTGGPPTTSQWLGGESIRRTIVLPGNLQGSGGTIPKTLPTASFVVSIKQNGTVIGTATCSTGGAWTLASTSGQGVTFVSGDEVDFYAPASTDATMADFGLTLFGSYQG